MELSIQRLSSQQASPKSSISLPSDPATSFVTQLTRVTPPQQSVKPTSNPDQGKSSALATSIPTHSRCQFSEIRMVIGTPPTLSDGEGNFIHVTVTGRKRTLFLSLFDHFF